MTVGITLSNLEDKIAVIVTDTQASHGGRGSNCVKKQRRVENENYAAVIFGAGHGNEIEDQFVYFNEISEEETDLNNFVDLNFEHYRTNFQKAKLRKKEACQTDFWIGARSKYGENSFFYNNLVEDIEEEKGPELYNEILQDIRQSRREEILRAIVSTARKKGYECRKEEIEENLNDIMCSEEKELKIKALKKTKNAVNNIARKISRKKIEEEVLHEMNISEKRLDLIAREDYGSSKFVIQAYDKRKDRVRNFLFNGEEYIELNQKSILIGSGRDAGGTYNDFSSIGTATVNQNLNDIMFEALGSYAYSTLNQGVGGTPLISIIDGKKEKVNSLELSHTSCAALTNIVTVYQSDNIISRSEALDYFSRICDASLTMANAQGDFQHKYGKKREEFHELFNAKLNPENPEDKDLIEIRNEIRSDYESIGNVINKQWDIIRSACQEFGEQIGINADIILNTTIPFSSWKEYVNVRRQYMKGD